MNLFVDAADCSSCQEEDMLKKLVEDVADMQQLSGRQDRFCLEAATELLSGKIEREFCCCSYCNAARECNCEW